MMSDKDIRTWCWFHRFRMRSALHRLERIQKIAEPDFEKRN